MNTRTRVFAMEWLLVPFHCLPSLASAWVADGTFAQREERATAAAIGGMLLVLLLMGLVFHVYFALCLQMIAKKTHTENAWLAWIPIVNLILLLNTARKPLWWILLMFIPIVNLVIGVLVWVAIAEALGKPNWWGILMIVPVANLVVPGYLAFSD